MIEAEPMPEWVKIALPIVSAWLLALTVGLVRHLVRFGMLEERVSQMRDDQRTVFGRLMDYFTGGRT